MHMVSNVAIQEKTIQIITYFPHIPESPNKIHTLLWDDRVKTDFSRVFAQS